MQEQEAPKYNKWALLFTVLVMTFMVCLDSSIVSVALPLMQKELSVGLGEIQWVSSIYLFVTCLGVIPFGRLGDRWSKVNVFQIGVIIFTLGSLVCGISTTISFLIFGRIIQGIGCAAAMANNMGIITEAFPARERGRAMGLLSTFVALGMMAGPVLGGILISITTWDAIFLINVPVGIISFFVGLKTLPHHAQSAHDRAHALTFLESARLCFSHATFTLNLLTMLIVFIGIGASEFVLPFYFQDAHGFSAQVASLLFMVIPLVNAVVGPISGSVSDRIGSEGPTIAGLLIDLVGMILVGMLSDVSPLAQIVTAVAIMSLGPSVFQSPNNALFMGSAPEGTLGFAGSLGSLSRYAGMAIGVSGSSYVLYGQMSAAIGYTVSEYVPGRPDVFLAGYSAVFMVLAGIVAVGFVLTIVRLALSRSQRTSTQGHVA